MSEGPLDAAALYRAHAPYVAGFLARIGARRDEMDDLLQEVFMVAHRRGGYAPGPARPTTWLAEIALRVQANARRAHARREPLSDRADDQEAGGTPESALESSRRRDRMQRCLDVLDEEHRAVLILFEIEGEGCAEIACALGVPVGTVYSRLHTARRKVQAAWRAAAEDGSP